MSGIYGADVATAVSVAQWQALKAEKNLSFGAARCYRSIGQVDVNAAGTVKNGWSAQLANVDVYHFPSLKVGAEAQVDAAVSALQAAGAQFGMYWLDVEQSPGNWSTSDFAANSAFLTSLVQAAEARGLTVGMYTSLVQWSAIMGSSDHQFAAYPLWYAAYQTPPNPSFSDFKPFGGWTQPTLKQFTGSTVSSGVGYDSNWCPAPYWPAGGGQ